MKPKKLYLPVLATTLIFVMAFSLVNVGVVTGCHGSTHIILYPSGGDDTAQIQAAFDMVAGKKRSTIELVAGVFTVSEPIQAADFDGTFKGAGKDATTIQTVDGFGIARLPLPPYGMVFVFYQENMGTSRSTATKVSLSDMTIQTVGITKTWVHMGFPMNYYMPIVWITGGYEVHEDPTPNVFRIEGRTSYVSSSFTRMRFVCDTETWSTIDAIQIYEGGTFNVVDGDIGAPLGSNRLIGTHTITKSDFEFCVRSGVYVIGLHDSTFKFGGSSGDGNTMSFIPGGTGVLFANVYSCNIRISHCETFGSTLMGIFQEYWAFLQEEVGPSPSRFYINHNIIRPLPEFFIGCIDILDVPEGLGGTHTVNLFAFQNTFICDDTMAIYASHVDSAKLIKNTIEGTGSCGIYVDGPSDRWFLLCNDLDGFTESVADIYLGPESTNCFAVVHDADMVVDDGTDNRIIRLPF